jgi:HrpA-like RNA helicase
MFISVIYQEAMMITEDHKNDLLKKEIIEKLLPFTNLQDENSKTIVEEELKWISETNFESQKKEIEEEHIRAKKIIELNKKFYQKVIEQGFSIGLLKKYLKKKKLMRLADINQDASFDKLNCDFLVSKSFKKIRRNAIVNNQEYIQNLYKDFKGEDNVNSLDSNSQRSLLSNGISREAKSDSNSINGNVMVVNDSLEADSINRKVEVEKDGAAIVHYNNALQGPINNLERERQSNNYTKPAQNLEIKQSYEKDQYLQGFLVI